MNKKRELQAFTNEIKDLPSSRIHLPTCKCCSCQAKRGEYSGVKHYNYNDGRSFEKHYCIDCDREIGWRAWYYGTRKCVSCVKKGRIHTEEHKRKIKIACAKYAFKVGHTTNVGKRPWNDGVKYYWSEEARLRNKNSPYQFKSGELHPNWKGGLSSANELIRASDEFARWRTDVLQRDKFLCVVCGSSHKLEAHHIIELSSIIQKYDITSLVMAYDCQELWDISNGETRCYQCHKLTRYGQQNN